MRHVPFKRLLMVLVPCVLVFGIMLPLTAFAAAAKHQAPAAAQAADATTTVSIKNRCGPASLEPPNSTVLEGAFTLDTLKNGQEIDITATVTGDDATHEQEALSVYAVGQPFIRIIFANTGTQSFEYEAHIGAGNTVPVVTCFVLLRDDDESDFTLPAATFFAVHTATVKYEVEAASIKESEI